jgi:hypothetical protein
MVGSQRIPSGQHYKLLANRVLTMKKLKIAIDIDDCIAEYTRTLTFFYNKVYDGQLTINDIKVWDLKTAYEKTGTPESIRALMDCFIQHPSFLQMAEVPGATAAIRRLIEEGHEVFFISARGSKAIDLCYKWFYEHNLPLKNIYFNRDKWWLVDKLGIDVMIDDGMHNLNAIETQLPGRVECVVFERPWNEKAASVGPVHRANTWPTIIRMVEHLAQ